MKRNQNKDVGRKQPENPRYRFRGKPRSLESLKGPELINVKTSDWLRMRFKPKQAALIEKTAAELRLPVAQFLRDTLLHACKEVLDRLMASRAIEELRNLEDSQGRKSP